MFFILIEKMNIRDHLVNKGADHHPERDERNQEYQSEDSSA